VGSQHSEDHGRSFSAVLALYVTLCVTFGGHADAVTQVRIVKHAFDIIHLLTDQNPVQVCVDAIINRCVRPAAAAVAATCVLELLSCTVTRALLAQREFLDTAHGPIGQIVVRCFVKPPALHVPSARVNPFCPCAAARVRMPPALDRPVWCAARLWISRPSAA
jgi:hypothetical protein